MSTNMARNHQRAVSRDQVAQYSLGCTQIGPRYLMERNNIYLTIGIDSTSRVKGSTSHLKIKTEQGCIHQVKKNKASQKIQREISSLTAKCK